MTKITLIENTVRGAVRAIHKAITEDIPQDMRDKPLETYNAIAHRRGDFINENLRRLVVGVDVEMHSFKRNSWNGRILVDRRNKITYTVITQASLRAILRNKNREKPHYLQSILAVENGGYEGKMGQRSFFPEDTFDTRILQKDYDRIVAGQINPSDGYQHYIIAYKSKQGELQDVKLKFLDKDFNIVDMASLNEHIKPDFARLTDAAPLEGHAIDKPTEGSRSLVKLKAGIRPKLREVKKEA